MMSGPPLNCGDLCYREWRKVLNTKSLTWAAERGKRVCAVGGGLGMHEQLDRAAQGVERTRKAA